MPFQRQALGLPGSRSARLNAPHSAATVCTPAAFPARTSWTESPTKTASSGAQSSRWSAIRTGSGSGLCRVRRVAADDRVHVAGRARRGPGRACASASDLLVTMPSSWPRVVSVATVVDDVVVAADQPVVVRDLVLAVGGDQRGAVRLVARVAAEHREQRNADAGEPLVVRRACAVELSKAYRAELRISSIESMSVPSRSKRMVGERMRRASPWRSWPSTKIAASMQAMTNPFPPGAARATFAADGASSKRMLLDARRGAWRCSTLLRSDCITRCTSPIAPVKTQEDVRRGLGGAHAAHRDDDDEADSRRRGVGVEWRRQILALRSG